MLQHDKVNKLDVENLVDGFPGQSIDFFGALRARVYDDRVRQFVTDTGIENIGKALVNSCAPSLGCVLPAVCRATCSSELCQMLCARRDLSVAGSLAAVQAAVRCRVPDSVAELLHPWRLLSSPGAGADLTAS